MEVPEVRGGEVKAGGEMEDLEVPDFGVTFLV